MKYKEVIRFSSFIVPMLLLSPLAQAASISVACPGQSLQSAVNVAQPGDVIHVTGTCSENIFIKNDKAQFTLDGGNVTTINAPSATSAAMHIRGKGIAVQNFTILGGLDVIEVSRASGVAIIHNVIGPATFGGAGSPARYGILVNDLSFAVITNNTIQNNPKDGVLLNEGAIAHIGYNLRSDSVASPNLIQGNGRRGITVTRNSDAGIFGNTIQNNGDDGIFVGRNSHADISSNVINGNGTTFVQGSGCCNGIHVSQNSSVNLGDNDTSTFFGQPNTSTVNNFNFGGRCTLGGVVQGHTGSLATMVTGDSGAATADPSCPVDLVTP